MGQGDETRVLSDRVALDDSLTLKDLLTSQTFGSQKPLFKVFVTSGYICQQMFIFLVHNAHKFSDLV